LPPKGAGSWPEGFRKRAISRSHNPDLPGCAHQDQLTNPTSKPTSRFFAPLVTETQRPIWKVFADTEDIPEAEWERLPTDLATQHDHYIYGTSKRPV
jgi:hypothetical protein